MVKKFSQVVPNLKWLATKKKEYKNIKQIVKSNV